VAVSGLFSDPEKSPFWWFIFF